MKGESHRVSGRVICLVTASYHPPGATQEDAGSCRFSSGFTRGLPSPRAFPGLLRILQTETPGGFVARQRKRMFKAEEKVLFYLQPREVSRQCVCPKSLVKPWKLMGEKFLKTKENIYLWRVSEAAHLSLDSRSAALLPEHCSRPTGDRGGVGVSSIG